LIVITDGEDRHSYFTEAQLMERLRKEDVQIYIIRFVNELDKERGFVKEKSAGEGHQTHRTARQSDWWARFLPRLFSGTTRNRPGDYA
jgi:hypothetical protein